MLDLNGSFSDFISSLFGFLSELLTGIFSGLHVDIT